MPDAAVSSCNTKPGRVASDETAAGPRSMRAAAAIAATNGIATSVRRSVWCCGGVMRAAAESLLVSARSGDDARVVLLEITLVHGIGRVGVAARVGIFPDRVEGQGADCRAERGIQVRVLDPAVRVQQEVALPAARNAV